MQTGPAHDQPHPERHPRYACEESLENGHLVIRLGVPAAVHPAAIEVSVDAGVLTVWTSHHDDPWEPGSGIGEPNTADVVSAVFALPRRAEPDGVRATLHAGVLRVSIPLGSAPTPRGQVIPVTAEPAG